MCAAPNPSRQFAAALLNRLDVSKYYVIRTIIILNISVEGCWVLKFLRGDVRSPAVFQYELPGLGYSGSGFGHAGRGHFGHGLA
jgi:hypothetical protein